MTTAIILAGGKSTRMGDGVDKAFLSLVNKPMVAWSLLAFERSTASFSSSAKTSFSLPRPS